MIIHCRDCPMANKDEIDELVFCTLFKEYRRADWFCTTTLAQVLPFYERMGRFIELFARDGSGDRD